MQNSLCGASHIRLAIAHGVPSRQLSALLALQREEEPEVAISLSEVSDDVLMDGLREGRYDAGLVLEDVADAFLYSQQLWREEMAIVMPLRHPLLEKTALTLDDVLDCPIFRWQAEVCPLLDQQISSLPERSCDIQPVASFELMAMWVAAGYGIGITARSRIANARAWDVCMRPFTDVPYEIITYLIGSDSHRHETHERFGRRAVQTVEV